MIHLFYTIKLLFRKDRELYSALHNILGFYPRHIDLYKQALAHRSLGFRDKSGHTVNNERLEFLGDAIIEAAVSDIVFHHFKRKPEGFLTTTRSKLVQRDTLNKLSVELGLDRLIQIGGHMAGHNRYTGGNAFEALVGAVYLDRGYKNALVFLRKRILAKHINIDKMAKKEVNFKSKLLEWSQRNRIMIIFQLADTDKPGTDSPFFTSQIELEGIIAGKGGGYSKKESQQNAAHETLKMLADKDFLNSILAAKEKRTAMEADLVSNPPAVSEERGQELRTEPHVSRRSRRKAAAAKAETEKVKSEKEAENSDAAEKVESEGHNSKKDTPIQQNGEAETIKGEGLEPSAGAGKEKTTPSRRRKKADKKPQPAEDQEPKKKRKSEKSNKKSEREEIISLAEEAAFNTAKTAEG